MNNYDPNEIEQKWQQRWQAEGVYDANRHINKPKYYVLDMFPYPSGKGLHVGHLKGYVASDVVSRYKRMRGYAVLHPMGWDSFGLPTERQAQKEGISPQEVTTRNIEAFKTQLKAVGLSYDWSRELATSDPEYYQWTQWIFSHMFEKGLAYIENVPVNWCPALETVLANEEVVDGKYIETGDIVERRKFPQWMLKITAYADRLLDDLDDLDWPEPIKQMQRNWIGRSEGAYIDFIIDGHDASIRVFTTRPDTIFGVTYLVLAPEHQLVDKITNTEQSVPVSNYIQWTVNRDEIARMAEGKEKTGVFTGAYVINPVNKKRIPIWIADYVLMGYGTGAIMAVPGQDNRDWDFAKTFDLPIIRTVEPPVNWDGNAYTGDGLAINSDFLNGLDISLAKTKIIDWLEQHEVGARMVNYKLRDWLFSRQRHWGEPIPILHGKDGTLVALDDKELPLLLPDIDQGNDTEHQSQPKPPLAFAPLDWLHVKRGEQLFQRETNTMPQWAGSCWYYLRFLDPRNSNFLCDSTLEKKWMPVDLYVGGSEHATLHLLYSRFWHKFLFDLGIVTTKEPFKRLFNQGMVHGRSFRDMQGRYYYEEEVREENGEYFAIDSNMPLNSQIEKMSKSKCNGVPPEIVIDQYGADALRLYEMFMGPIEDSGLWNTNGIKGTWRFIERLWKLLEKQWKPTATLPDSVNRELHITIKKVTESIENLQLNTAISQLMILLNAASQVDALPTTFFQTIAKLLQPFAPHLAEEIWEKTGGSGFVVEADWPEYDSSLISATITVIPVQVSGKLRGTIEVPLDISKEDVVAQARKLSSVERYLDGHAIKEVIYIPSRIINFVV